MSSVSQMQQGSAHNIGQLEELLKVVETKIQVIIRETKKIIEKLTTDFDKKLSKGNTHNNHEQNSIAKIQNHCRDAINQMEQHYQR